MITVDLITGDDIFTLRPFMVRWMTFDLLDLWPFQVRPDDIALEKSPEEENVGDPHDEHGRTEHPQVYPRHPLVVDEHPVDDPRYPEEATGQKGQEVEGRVQLVQPVVERPIVPERMRS